MVANASQPIPGRLPPAPLLRVPDAYRTTVFHAPLVDFDPINGVVSLFPVPAASLGNPIPVLLFLADFPASLKATSQYLLNRYDTDDATTFIVLPQEDFSEVAENFGGNAVPWDLLWAALAGVVPAGGADLGQPVRGATLTNALPQVAGYTVQITPVDRSILTAGAAAHDADSIRLECTCQGGVIDGRGNGTISEYRGAGTVSPVTGANYPLRAAVILRENQYTAAMRAAGNILAVAGAVVQIVGIFAPNP